MNYRVCPSCGAAAWGSAFCWLCVLHWHCIKWETREILLRNSARRLAAQTREAEDARSG